MAVFTEKNVQRLCHWLKLRRLAFRFDRKTKVLCLVALIVPGVMAVGSIPKVIASVLFALCVFIVLPILTGWQTLSTIRNRFGVEVATRALQRCEFGRYAGDKTFTIGDIQKEIAAEQQTSFEIEDAEARHRPD